MGRVEALTWLFFCYLNFCLLPECFREDGGNVLERFLLYSTFWNSSQVLLYILHFYLLI